jgi:Tetratricopeptide repeat
MLLFSLLRQKKIQRMVNSRVMQVLAIAFGRILYANGEHDTALEIHRLALTIQKAVLGDHPSTATNYSNIGLVLGEKGDSWLCTNKL